MAILWKTQSISQFGPIHFNCSTVHPTFLFMCFIYFLGKEGHKWKLILTVIIIMPQMVSTDLVPNLEYSSACLFETNYKNVVIRKEIRKSSFENLREICASFHNMEVTDAAPHDTSHSEQVYNNILSMHSPWPRAPTQTLKSGEYMNSAPLGLRYSIRSGYWS